jgi:hypothetical protein
VSAFPGDGTYSGSPSPSSHGVVERDQSETAGALPALSALLSELERRKVQFCHWKSNIHLAAAVQGRTDLDLLVDRNDASTVMEVLGQHGLKPMGPPPGGAQPGMSHYLGFDAASGGLFHLHVHYQLVIGQRGVKNYRLPVERQFLTGLRRSDGVPVPAPAVELAMLSIRTLLKYRYRDAVKDALGIRHPGVPSEVRDEVEWLLSQTTVEAAASALGVIPSGLLEEFLTLLRRDQRAGFLGMRRRLRKAMRPYARVPPVQARWEAMRWLWIRRQVFRIRDFDPGMKMSGGGLTIALLGADGAGKTTAADDLESWLGWKLSVRRYYLGSKQPSRASSAAYLGFRAFRRLHRAAAQRFGEARPVRWLEAMRDGLLGAHYVAVAGDRLRRDRRAANDRLRGRVIVLDRCPLPAVSSERHHRMLDGPQIADSIVPPLGRMARRMATREEAIYTRFSLPDVLLALEVDTHVSVDRKPDHLPLVISQKRKAVSELAELIEIEHPEVKLYRIDANDSLERVRLEIRQAVWHEL